MRKIFYLAVSIIMMTSCAGSKKIADETRLNVQKNLEGEKVMVEEGPRQGIAMAESLNEEGTGIVKRPFKWYAGTGKADDKQVAIELAQSEAYATISRIMKRAVLDQTERGNVVTNQKVQQALTQHWEMVSTSILKGCEPFGNVKIEYSQTSKMYTVTAKVAIRGDRFNQLLQTAGNFTPKDLTGEDLEQFIEVNKSIMKAAKGE